MLEVGTQEVGNLPTQESDQIRGDFSRYLRAPRRGSPSFGPSSEGAAAAQRLIVGNPTNVLRSKYRLISITRPAPHKTARRTARRSSARASPGTRACGPPSR